MIDLANRTNHDMWVNIPHLADDDYSHQLAALIQANLKSGLKVYVEWSNETWNGQFQQTHYSYDRGNALGLDSDPWSAAFKYQVYAAVRVFAQFEQVFGKNSPRVVKVLAGQSDNSWLTGVHIAALKDTRINPLGITANAYAIAPYFGLGVDGNSASAITQLADDMKSVLATVAEQHTVIAGAGLRMVAYEGGQHVLTGANVVNARPEMYQLYTSYLDGVAPYFDVFMHYCHSGTWNSGGAWGAETNLGATGAGSYKLKAINDWMAKHQ
jgi:hypothetical protein